MQQAGLEDVLAAARALLALAEEQRAALEGGALDRIAQLLEQRDVLLRELGARIEARGAALAGEFARAPEATRQAVLRAFASVATIDAQSEAWVRLEMRGILDELPAMEAGRRAAAAYRSRTPAAYVDTAS